MRILWEFRVRATYICAHAMTPDTHKMTINCLETDRSFHMTVKGKLFLCRSPADLQLLYNSKFIQNWIVLACVTMCVVLLKLSVNSKCSNTTVVICMQ